ncbi:MAG TPA: hypothetical protein VFN25_12720, partial [Dokdonella sp.]|uniref:hypothetical protein n=1 Tax=Dokdonella sp. TaxID=2291710 RepID=UPI002D80F7F4
HWWAEELSGFAAGRARHPLTEVLLGYAPICELGADAWEALIPAAFAQREAGPFSTLGDMLDANRHFQTALANIEVTLHPVLDIENSATAASLSCVFDESVRLAEMLARDRLPISMDLLARHQLSRSEIGQAGPRRDAVLREHFLALAARVGASETRGLSPLTAIRLQANLKRCRRAAKAEDVLAESARNLDRLPPSSVWAGWKAARRMRASG